MATTAEADLGREIARFSGIPRSGAQALVVPAMVVSIAVGLGFLAMGSFFILLTGPDAPQETVWTYAIGHFAVGAVLVVVGVLGIIENLGAKLIVCADGIVVRQPWFRRWTFPFSEVESLEVPHAEAWPHVFAVQPRSGKRKKIARLSLEPVSVRGGDGELQDRQHPDVDVVLDAYEAYCLDRGETPQVLVPRA